MTSRFTRLIAGIAAVASITVVAGPALADNRGPSRPPKTERRTETTRTTTTPTTTTSTTSAPSTTNPPVSSTTTTPATTLPPIAEPVPGSVEREIVPPDVALTVDGTERPIKRTRNRSDNPKASKVRVRSNADLAAGIAVDADGNESIAIAVEGLDPKRERATILETGTVVYKDALPGKTDVELTVSDTNVALAVDIEKKQAPTEYRFRFDGTQRALQPRRAFRFVPARASSCPVEPLSPSNRNRVPKLSGTYRSHAVQHEPNQHL